jgi:hypothetical protein
MTVNCFDCLRSFHGFEKSDFAVVFTLEGTTCGDTPTLVEGKK